jgi:hypothetical protein
MQKYDMKEYPQEHVDLMGRNRVRMEEVKQKMGTAWLLHPQNKVVRNPELAKPILTHKCKP